MSYETDVTETATSSFHGNGYTLVSTLLVPLVTIVGLIMLIALQRIDAAAGLGLIGGLAGLHGGAAVANTGK